MKLLIFFIFWTWSYKVYQYPKKVILVLLPHQLPQWETQKDVYLQTYLDYYSLLKTMSTMLPFKIDIGISFPDFYSSVQLTETQTFLNQVQRHSIPSVIISNESNTTRLLSDISSFQHKLKSYQFAISLTKTVKNKCLGNCDDKTLVQLSQQSQKLKQEIPSFHGLIALDYRRFNKNPINIILDDVFAHYYEATDNAIDIILQTAKHHQSLSASFDVSEFGNSMYFQNCGFLGNILNKAYQQNITVNFIVNRTHWILSENSQLFVRFLEMFKMCIDSFELI
ncbi:hypothetical protein ENUP19_0317G0004 [Entamoeba nuttalli]|uniref:Uncharacterized protein n=1 Tax=Entamoeba nuttalli TaxID=412467 RepID=A0ABQ0DVX8_9EUKA